MYRKLNAKEIAKFQKKYFTILGERINSVSVIKYKGVAEYLVNDKYMVRVKRRFFPFSI